MKVSAINNLSPTQSVAHQRKLNELRGMVDEAVGVTFFGEMLKIARNNPYKAEFAHGGRGEEIFRGQLDMELARRVGQATQTGISEAIYRDLAGHVRVPAIDNEA